MLTQQASCVLDHLLLLFSAWIPAFVVARKKKNDLLAFDSEEDSKELALISSHILWKPDSKQVSHSFRD